MVKITKRDKALISCLREDARITLTQMSKKTRIPISTLYDRLKAQKGSLIMKHTTLLNFDALGFGTRVQLVMRVPPHERDALQQHLSYHAQVNNVFELAAGFDYMVEAIFRLPKDLKEFVSQLQQRFPTMEYQSHFITKDIKREGFVAS